MSADVDPRVTAFLAWRNRRALEAGVGTKPEQILDEWKFKRILITAPADIYELENMRLLTAPLFAQYGDDLLSLSRGKPTVDELPKVVQNRLREESKVIAPTPRARKAVASERPVSKPTIVHSRLAVRRDDPTVTVGSKASVASADRRIISDFAPSSEHEAWSKRSFDFHCSIASFKFWETEFLETWGALLEALANGTEAAVTEDELAVAALTNRSRRASKEWEQAWVKLVLRRAYEAN